MTPLVPHREPQAGEERCSSSLSYPSLQEIDNAPRIRCVLREGHAEPHWGENGRYIWTGATLSVDFGPTVGSPDA